MRIILIIFFLILGSYANEPFDNKEIQVLKHILADDIETYNEGGDSMLDYSKYIKNLVNVSADTIQKDYERNEVAADMKYENKIIVVNGVVAKIRKDAFNNILVDLKGGKNQFLTPSAQFKKDYIDWVSKLEKNKKIYIVCAKSKFIISSVMLQECSPNKDWSKFASDMFGENANELLKNEDKNFVQLRGFFKELLPELKADSSCFSNNNTKLCLKEIEKFLSMNSKNK